MDRSFALRSKEGVQVGREQLRGLFVLVLLIGGIGCGGPWDPTAASPPILVITAMPLELAPLLEMIEVDGTEIINGRTHHLGRIGGAQVALVAGGVSMVKATMAAQAAIDALGVRAIVYCGIAGGASPRIRIGDVIVPEQWAQYQEHVFTDASRTGWRRGWRNESLGHFEMMFPQRVWAARPNDAPDAEELKLWFRVDESLIDAVALAEEGLVLERCTSGGQCVEHQPAVVIGGSGVSGPTFVDDARYRDWVWQTFKPLGFDMETAAVGHVAYANGIPYIGVRGISDMAGANPKENRVESYAPMAARNAASVVAALLHRMVAR